MRILGLIVGALLILVFAAVVLVNETDEGYTGPGPDEQEPARVSVDQIVTLDERWFREPVRVQGEVVRVDGDRFVLRGDQAAIVVQPEGASRDVERGQRVEVVGVVTGLSRLQVDELAQLARGSRRRLAGAPITLDSPYVAADRVTPLPA